MQDHFFKNYLHENTILIIKKIKFHLKINENVTVSLNCRFEHFMIFYVENNQVISEIQIHTI